MIWVEQDTFGFCFVQGVEATPEATERLTLRIANIRQTQCKSLPLSSYLG